MTLCITPLDPLLTPHATSETIQEPLVEYIHQYALTFFQWIVPLFYAWNTLEFDLALYEIAQISFTYLGGVGYAATLLLIVGGYTKVAFLVIVLSSANFVGAYITYQAKIQQSLSKSTRLFEKQLTELKEINADLKETNIELKNTSEELKQTNHNLTTQVSLFTEQNTQLGEKITRLENANQQLNTHIDSLKTEVDKMQQCNIELKDTTRILQEEGRLWGEQNTQWRLFADQYKIEMQEYLSHADESNQTHGELLEQFADKITLLEQFREQAEEQQTTDHNDLRQILEEFMQVLFNVRHLQAYTERQQETLKALEELGRLTQTISIQEGTLNSLNQEHQRLNQEHQRLLQEHESLLQKQKDILASCTRIQAQIEAKLAQPQQAASPQPEV